MQIKRAVTWLPIDVMPEDRKDGRYLLLWDGKYAHIARWSQQTSEPNSGAWDTGYSGEVSGDAILVEDPTHWSDCDGPEVP